MGDKAMDLQTRQVGALPIINHFIKKLELGPLLERYLYRPGRQPAVPHGKVILAVLRNFLIDREPLYGLGDWARQMEPSLLEVGPRQLHDDRAGNGFDRLFASNRRALTFELVGNAVEAFELEREQLHMDTTTATLCGAYATANGQLKDGKPTLVITWGKNKDHRPDLKQLLVELTVTADGMVPVFFDAHDGNTTDDQLHRRTWDLLHQIVGHPRFLYVADSKLCVRETMSHIDGQQGRFVTVLPQTRAEDKKFKDFVQNHDIEWGESVWKRTNTRGQDKPPDIYRAYIPSVGTAEGYRLVWYHSSDKERHDRCRREDLLHKTELDLEALDERLQSRRTRLRTELAVRKEIDKILSARQSAKWMEVEVHGEKEEVYKQETAGRPGPDTRYVRTEKKRFRITWKQKTAQVQYDENIDGIFPLVSNDHSLSPQQILLAYKQQPRLEKRFEQYKTVFGVMAVLLKSPSRIEAFLHVFFWLMLIQALIERQLRKAMKAQNITGLPLYPEDRRCEAPTVERIFRVFDRVQVSRLFQRGKLIQVFQPELSDLQKQVLALLGVPLSAYRFA
jgi:transposase